MCKTNPISGQPGPRERPIVQNEANSSIADCGLGTDLWQGDESCKTNPISGQPGTVERSIVRNEPNSSIADCGLRIADWAQTSGRATNRPKRTQFRASRDTQRSSIPLFHLSSPMRIVRNKPNLAPGVRKWAQAGRRGPNRAKRTQFPAVPGGTGPEGRGTKGKCAKRTQFRPRAGIRRRIVQNEPNSRRGLGRGQWDEGRGLSCKTKPICDLGAEPMGPVPAAGCRPDPRRELRKNPMRPGAASVSIPVEPLSGKPGNL